MTLLAQQICQVPIALISLVDETRQWFKSRVGVSHTETPLDFAFCPYAILDPSEMLIVQDAQKDPRFAESPRVTGGPKIRFYAGAPLVTPDGLALGTLCVIDHVPRDLTAEQKTALHSLSRIVITQLELRRNIAAHRQLEEQLQSLNALLEQKVEARTGDLRIAATAFESQESLMITDSDGVILRVNQAFTEMHRLYARRSRGKDTASAQVRSPRCRVLPDVVGDTPSHGKMAGRNLGSAQKWRGLPYFAQHHFRQG